MRPLISIIVPIYNVQSYLEKCIDSIIAQTYTNLEILLIDDGSTDASPIICDSYQTDKRVKVYHRQNEGLSSCRQFGINNSNGIYFMTIDSDDYITKECIEKLYNIIDKTQSDIAACCRYDFIDNNKRRVPLKGDYEEIISTDKKIISTHLDTLNNKVWLSDSWNKLYRTSFVKKTGVKFELNRRFNGNDFAFNYKLVLHCPQYCTLNEPLLYHRLTPNSMVRRNNKPLQEGFETVLSQIIDESNICGYDKMLIKQIDLIYSKMLLLTALDIYKYYDGNYDLVNRLSNLFKRDSIYRNKHTFLRKIIIKDNMKTWLITVFIKYKLRFMLLLLFKLRK